MSSFPTPMDYNFTSTNDTFCGSVTANPSVNSDNQFFAKPLVNTANQYITNPSVNPGTNIPLNMGNQNNSNSFVNTGNQFGRNYLDGPFGTNFSNSQNLSGVNWISTPSVPMNQYSGNSSSLYPTSQGMYRNVPFQNSGTYPIDLTNSLSPRGINSTTELAKLGEE